MSDSHTRSHREGGIGFIGSSQRSRRRLDTNPSVVQNYSVRGVATAAAHPSPTIAPDVFDDYGTEFGSEARVWKAYVKEADKFDKEIVGGWSRSLDITLVFAALFSAICTAFVLESSKSLRRDTTETSTHRLDQIASILVAIANGSDVSGFNTTQISDSEQFSPRPVDIYVNILWFFSLILSFAVAFLSLLAKDWCNLFISGRIGSHWLQTKRRQQRWEGIEKWKMEQVIMLLPSFIHLAFLLFATGLCIYLGDLYMGVAVPVAAVALGLMFAYAVLSLLPLLNLFDTVCPYSTAISRFFQQLRRRKTPGKDNKGHGSIEIRALLWLIKSCEDPKSRDIALQAIAGAGPNDEDRALLKESGVDEMILRRLLNLDSRSRNYKRLLDLYTRAQAFFKPPRPNPMTEKEEPIPDGKAAFDTTGEAQNRPTRIPRKYLNGELQKKLRNLREALDRRITTYATSDPDFLPNTDNIQALRIGNNAASYCLQSLQSGTQGQALRNFDSAVQLLERCRNYQAHLNNTEVQYLTTGVATMLSSLLVDCPQSIRARCFMRLLRIAGRAKGARRQLSLEHLALPLVVYALSRHDYPGWTRRPPLGAISRAERAIEVISYYVSNPDELESVTPTMVNLGVLELLLDAEECDLDGTDITAISEAFRPLADDAEVGHASVYTLPPSPYAGTFSRTVKSIAAMASHESYAGLFNEGTVAALSMLNRTQVDYPIQSAPLGRVYAFVIECVLNLSSHQGTHGQNVALDLMQKFYNTSPSDWSQANLHDLAQSLDRNQTLAKLEQAIQVEASNVDPEFSMKLFATGQAWFLIDVAIKSKTTNHPGWKCLIPFVREEITWDSPGVARMRLGEHRDTLAEQYRRMWKGDGYMQRHRYLEILYDSLPPI